jgi:transcriptional regulator with XRE-family HTH domain
MDKKQIKREHHKIDCIVGAQIRATRRYANISQEELGALLGVTFQQLQKYENGTNRVAASKLYCLHQILDVPLDYFFAPSLCAVAGIDKAYHYDPDFIKWVQAYETIPAELHHTIAAVVKAAGK